MDYLSLKLWRRLRAAHKNKIRNKQTGLWTPGLKANIHNLFYVVFGEGNQTNPVATNWSIILNCETSFEASLT